MLLQKGVIVIDSVSLFITLFVMCSGNVPDITVHGANMGPNWVLSAPDGPPISPMNLAIRGPCGCLVAYYYRRVDSLDPENKLKVVGRSIFFIFYIKYLDTFCLVMPYGDRNLSQHSLG